MNFDSILLPEFAVQTAPELSTATPMGALSNPNPPAGQQPVLIADVAAGAGQAVPETKPAKLVITPFGAIFRMSPAAVSV